MHRKTGNKSAYVTDKSLNEVASLNIDLRRKRLTMTKDGDPRASMNGPRGKFTLSQSDSLKMWKGVMDYAAEQNSGRQLTKVELIQSLAGSSLKGPMGTRNIGAIDGEQLEAFTTLYHYMKNTRGY